MFCFPGLGQVASFDVSGWGKQVLFKMRKEARSYLPLTSWSSGVTHAAGVLSYMTSVRSVYLDAFSPTGAPACNVWCQYTSARPVTGCTAWITLSGLATPLASHCERGGGEEAVNRMGEM